MDELAQLLTKLKRIGGAARPISDHLFDFPFLGFSSPPSSAPPSQFSGSYERGLRYASFHEFHEINYLPHNYFTGIVLLSNLSTP